MSIKQAYKIIEQANKKLDKIIKNREEIIASRTIQWNESTAADKYTWETSDIETMRDSVDQALTDSPVWRHARLND